MSNNIDQNTNDQNTNDEEKDKFNGRKKNWEVIKDFEKGPIVVTVSKLDLPIPRYSIEIATRTQFGDRKLGRHFPVQLDRKNGSPSVSNPIDKRELVKLIDCAYSFIENEEKIDMKDYLEWKKKKESETNKSENNVEDDEVLINRK